MQIGIVGLGRMGANIARRLMGDDHPCFIFDIDPAAVPALTAVGSVGADCLVELPRALFARFRLRKEYTFGEMLISAMRFAFGGHVELASKG